MDSDVEGGRRPKGPWGQLAGLAMTALVAYVFIRAGGDRLLMDPMGIADRAGAGWLVVLMSGVGTVSILVKWFRTKLPQSAFRHVELESLGPVPIGGTARLKLRLSPLYEVKVRGATIRLESTERAIYRGGRNTRVFTETIYDHDEAIALPEHVPPHFEQEILIPLTKDVPPTFRGEHNFLSTRVQVRVDVANLPDLVLESEVEVIPVAMA